MKSKLLLLLLVTLGLLQANAQVNTDFSGTLTNSQSFKRPVPRVDGNYTAQLQPSDMTAGTINYNYFTQTFTPATSGTYSVTITSSTISDQDTFLLIYTGSFNSASPLANLLKANDDISDNNLLSTATNLSLAAGVTYHLVVTTYNPGTTGNVNFRVSGSGGVVVGNAPQIGSATYNATSGLLTVAGTDFQAKAGAANDVVLNKLSFLGQGGGSYTLTSSAQVEITSATSFSATLDATDKAAVNLLLNKNGTSSIGGTVYNLAAAAGWMANVTAASDLTGNPITVSGVAANNQAPTDITLSASSINENVAANTAVGTLSTTDPDAGNTFTYTLVTGTGDTDNASFSISGSSLTINASPDFETKSSYSVRVRTTDQGGLTFEKAFTITINNVNEAPTDIALSATAINENVAAGTAIGTLTTTDPDASNTFTYTLVTGTGSTDNASFSITGNSLTINASPNFEAKSSYSVRIRTTDQGGLTFEKTFAITINNLNEAPTDITLSATSINENVAANTTVGTLSTSDPDASNTFTYALVTGTGSTDNASFSIAGNSLTINASPNFEAKSSYSVRIRTTDQGGLTFEKAFTITINNVNEAPTDIALSATAINENVAAGTAIGTLTTTDPDASNTFTYTLVSGTGSTDNASFTITGNSLAINVSPDFETKNSYSIRIRTTDQGGLTFEKIFTITINDIYEAPANAAPTNITLSASSVNENVAANTAVGTLSTTDPDAGNTFTYTLVAGIGSTDNASFSISGSSLTINASPDFETKSSYSVRIRTTDQGGLTFEKAFTITINNLNEAPTDIALSATAINENVAANTAVGTLSTTDPDASNTFTYALVSGTGSTDNASFSISGSSLTINASPDFETKSSYSVRIRTTDQGGLSFEKVFTITINNLNEAPTNIALSATSINENVAANTAVGTLSTTDPDAANTFTYALVSGAGSTDNASFTITGNSLAINISPDFETKSSYSIRIRTTDQGGLSFEKTFTITINDLCELNNGTTVTSGVITANQSGASYQWIQCPATILVGENGQSFTPTTPGSYAVVITIGSCSTLSSCVPVSTVNTAPTNISLSASAVNENVVAGATIGTLSTTDPDAGNTFTYTLVAGTGSTDNASFSISGSSLTINASPDFETKNSYSIRIRTTDQGGLTFEKTFAITINNLNEAPTDITLSATSINENVAANTTVGTLSTSDPDASNTFTYTLVSGTGSTDNASFSISGSTLTINASPDFEAKSSYSVRIRTTDQGGLSFEKTFTININNVNEAPTDIALSATAINENVAAGTAVGALSTTDPDASNTFTYTLVSGTGSTDNASFSISGSSLTINASPDFETKNSYSVRVRTTDQGGLTFEKTFTISINNVNEAPTDITLSATAINENVAAGTAIGTLSTTDPDASNTFTYTLVTGTGSTDNASFSISGSSLTINASPDFETKGSYNIRIRTTDQGGLTFEKTFTITINNINEAPTNIALSATSINENVVAGTAVGTLSTTDPDASNTFTYTLVTGTGSTDNASFTITGNSLTINTSPDFETKSSYSVRIRTTDQGGLTFEKTFTININNVNETPTDIALSATSINENVAANTAVGTLSTTDPDASNTFTYTLVTGTGSTDNASFSISGSSLTINASPDFETKNSYSVRIRTTDQGGLTFEKTFTITINNLNEAPTDLTLSATAINENVAANTTVGTLSTTDQDAGNTFTYALVTGTGSTDNASFSISGSSLTINASPNFETKSSYSVRIRTTDQGGLTFEKTFTITINNVNEAPTDIALSATAINENVAAGTAVGALSTTDPDASNTFTYSLVTGTGSTDNASFTITGNSLTINASPDFEAKNSYSVRIRTTDQGGLTFEKAFTITINNVNEAPTDIALSATAINENVAAGTAIGTLSTTDPDASNTFTYSLVTGTGSTDNVNFSISGSSLTINASPNFEAKSSYSVRVRTTDQGGLTFEKVFTITINNVNEAPTDIALSATAINENVAAGTAIGTLSTTDPDASNTFTYSLVTGTGSTDNASFTITGNSLTINASPDFEAKNSYSVRIRTTDQGGLTFEKTFTININNVNEAPTNIALSATAIDENVAANTTVGTLSTTDPDAGNTFTYSLVTGTGSTDNASFTITGSSLAINASPDFETKSSYSVRIRTTDQGGLTFEKAFTITINDVVEINFITTEAALSSKVGVYISKQIEVNGGQTPYTFTIESGSFAPGLSLSTNGEMSGTPTGLSTGTVTVKVKDVNGVTALKTYNIAVENPSLVFSPTTIPAGTLGVPYQQTITGSGGTAPYSISLASGSSLPQGLTLTGNTISGTPTQTGTFTFTLSISDSSTGLGSFSVLSSPYSLVIGQGTQTITFQPTRTVTYGDADFDPLATSTNTTIPITYTSSDVSIATIVNNKVHLLKAGTVSIYANQAADASYLAAAQKEQVLTIAKKALSVSLKGTVTKTYDGNATATLSTEHFELTGVVNNDQVNIVVPVSGSYGDKNVAINKMVSVSNLSLGGTNLANYELSNTTAQSTIGTVTKKAITVDLNTSTVVAKTYDGNSTATVAATSYAFVGKVANDDLSVSSIATYNDKNAGSGKVVTLNGFTLSGTDKDNYDLTTTSLTTVGTIAAKAITLSLNATPAITKVYDGTNNATLAEQNYTLAGTLTGDVVKVSGVSTYDNKTVGIDKTITAGTFTLSGTDKDNYQLQTTSATTKGSITAKSLQLSLSITPLITKIYDGNNQALLASGNYQLLGIEPNDVVSVAGTASYDNKTVGSNKTVQVVNLQLNGADKDNYQLTSSTANTTGTITAKPITLVLSASPAITKVYDGQTSATLVAANYNLQGIVTNDVVSVNGLANFNNKTVGINKTITVNNFSLSGADKDNYQLTTNSSITTGSITAKTITLSLNANPVITKVYDGNRNATLAAANYQVVGIVSGDVLTFTGTAMYDSPTSGTGKIVTANTFIVGGTDKDNYSLTTTTAQTVGSIDKAALVITAVNKSKVQNTANPTFTATYSGFVNQENESILLTQPTFTTTATLGSTPGSYPIVPANATAQNYSISYVNGTLTVTPGTPTNIILAAVTLLENSVAGSLAGQLSSTSEDPNATFTYTLVAGSGDTDNALFAINGQQLVTTSALNYEQKANYSVRVKSTTASGLSLEKVFNIALTDVNEAPTLAVIANQQVCANSDQQTLVLSGISAGPETTQSTTLSVTSNNAALFASLTVSNDGVLRYMPRQGATGTALITVTVKDNGGTANGGLDSFSRSFTLTINSLPNLTITSTGGKISLSKGETISLTASGATSYTWLPASGIVGGTNGAAINIRPESTTTYTVRGTSAEGCTVTRSITITVEEDFLVVKGTNILTPNGDGINDRFVIRNIDMYPNNVVKIFDRAGRLVFQKTNYTDQFDGTFQGSPLAEDTYYYIVDFGPSKRKIKGFITIIRD